MTSASAISSAPGPFLERRDTKRRSAALVGNRPQRRVRAMPDRDARGRFVSFSTTSAPSWYVFSADAFRIRSEADVLPARDLTCPAPLPVARVVVQRRPGRCLGEVLTWLSLALFIIVMGCYGLSLPVPHR
jgi:hypothetical protein